MSNLFRILWQATYHLRKSPVFTLTTVLTLGIGIGATTAIYTMMDALVLRPLSVPDLDRIMNITEVPAHGGELQPVALANYHDWKQQSRSFASLAAYRITSINLTGAGQPAHIAVIQAEPSFFEVFEAHPLLGRTFTAGETVPGRGQVAVLSEGLWQQQFAGDPHVLGRSMELDHRAYTIVGVVPRTFRYPPIGRLWIPMASDPAHQADRALRDANLVGRLRPGVTRLQAQGDLKNIAVELARLYPASNTGWSVYVATLVDNINGNLTPRYMRMVLGASIFLLLVICANLTNLQFARALGRRSEIAVRSALGAGRLQLLSQLLAENLLLAAVGAVCGIVVAQLALDRITATMPPAVARYLAGWDTLHLDGRALACACIVATACAVLSGLAPAIDLFRVDLVLQLKSGSRSVSASKGANRLRNLFVVAQITFALILVMGSALMVKGMSAMSTVTQIYSPGDWLVAEVDLPQDRYDSPASLRSWFVSSTARFRALPGVQEVATTTALPYSNGGPWVDGFAVDNKTVEPGSFQASQRLTVSPNYLSAFHIPVLSGRAFAESDGFTTRPVAVVSRAFVQRYLPKENPIGHTVRFTGQGETIPGLAIVGVVEDVIYTWTNKDPQPAIYISANQFPPGATTYLLHSPDMRSTLPGEFRSILASLDSALPIDRLQTYAAYLHESLVGLNYVVVMLLEDAVIALLLSSIGIFGVIAISVAERTREIGIRLALGAQGREVIAFLLRRAVLLTVAGLALGIPLSLGVTHLLASLFFGVQPQDLGTLFTTAGLIAGVTLTASYLAARRGASVDPLRALQSD